MVYKEYTISFYGKQYSRKPDSKEAGIITSKLKPATLTYEFLAQRVGEDGCSFAPAVFNGSRRNENFIGQQLFAIDIDGGITFENIKERADRYSLPVLFAYKSFSWTPETEKYRLVFAADEMIANPKCAQIIQKILMQIFEECDEHCSDLARLFYGSNKGLLYLAEEPHEFSLRDLAISLNCCFNEKYGDKHYTRYIKEFYQSLGEETYRKVPVFAVERTHSTGRRRTTKIDFDTLSERCRFYRDFAEGNEYYYYPQLFRLATNLINMDKGKETFLRIIDAPQNAQCQSYHKRNWKVILNTLIDMQYQPMNCKGCPHEDNCLHYKNMILTVDAGKCGIRPVHKKEYVSVEVAEASLADYFKTAVEMETEGIKLIIAQTGLGKTNTYLHYLRNTKQRFLIAVPTHKLIREIYEKAHLIGVPNIVCMPEMPELSGDLRDDISHLYHIGAGQISLKRLRILFAALKPDHPDYLKLKDFFNKLDAAEFFDGHILMTHERFLYLHEDSPLLNNRTVIIDEDILNSAFSTITVSCDDIKRGLKMDFFDEKSKSRMKEILHGDMYQRYHTKAGIYLTEEDLPKQFDDIETNILDLLNAKVLVKYDDTVTFIKVKPFPTYQVIIMSATANPDLYRWLMYAPIEVFRCKQAKYMGTLRQYTNSSYSRKKLTNDQDQDALIQKVKSVIGEQAVITFQCCEGVFQTKYHYGAIEGLNELEGQDIAVIGLPNTDEKVYKLYGMLIGVDPNKESWKYKKIQYNGYEFYLNTFSNYRLRTIQLWMIESHLEQAVGRARLLRHPCNVTVFARFPIDQAEIV